MKNLNKEIMLLKWKLFLSVFNKVKLPLTNKNLIDKKQVRHVYKINIENFKAFYCMISGKAYILNYNEKLEDWFNLSEIEIKYSERIQQSKNVAVVSNMREYPENK